MLRRWGGVVSIHVQIHTGQTMPGRRNGRSLYPPFLLHVVMKGRTYVLSPGRHSYMVGEIID